MLVNPQVASRGWALTQVVRGEGPKRFCGCSLRTSRWRYTEWDEGRAGRELYNHDIDHQELVNLADDPDRTEAVAEWSRQLRKAVAASFPAGAGMPPRVRGDGGWPPVLGNP